MIQISIYLHLSILWKNSFNQNGHKQWDNREKKLKNHQFYFCIKSHKKWNNSFFPPWTDFKSHDPGIQLTIRFFWYITCLGTRTFLLFAFLDSVMCSNLLLSHWWLWSFFHMKKVVWIRSEWFDLVFSIYVLYVYVMRDFFLH